MTTVRTPQPGPAVVNDESPAAQAAGGVRSRAPRYSPLTGVLAGTGRTALNANLYVRLCRAGDVVIALLVLLGVFVGTNAGELPQGLGQFLEVRLSVRNVLILAAFVMLWRVLASAGGLYNWPRIRRPAAEFTRLLTVCCVVGVIVLSFPLISQSGAFGFHTAILFWAALVLGLMTGRLILRAAAAVPAAHDLRDVLIVGSGPRALQVYDDLREQPAAFRVIGFVDTNPALTEREIVPLLLGGLEDLERVLMTVPIDEVLITLPVRSRYAEIQRVIDLCERVGVPSRHMADVFRASRPWRSLEDAQQQRYMQISPIGPQGYARWIKRAVDIVVGSAALVALSPLMLLAALAVRFSGPGPIIFSQARYGLYRRTFRMYKFRTMVADAEAQQEALEERNEAAGPVFKIKDDPRITAVGRLLRRSSVDELPQLVNVVLGDMSLVGPRPLPARDVRRFNEAMLMRRFSVRPGLTCLWQIGGRSNTDFDRWIALDLKYIDEWSLWLDLAILARTVPVVLRGTGAV